MSMFDLFQGLQRSLEVSRTRRELNSLSDEQLFDIGLSRDHIDNVARGIAVQRAKAAPARRIYQRSMSLAPLFLTHIPGYRP